MSDWITTRKPTATDGNSNEDVWVCYSNGEVFSAKWWSAAAQDHCVAWKCKERTPEPYVSPRKFFDGTTYASPAMFLDVQTLRLWHGPVMPESTLHWGKCEGFNDHGEPIFVYCASEIPDGSYLRIETSLPKINDKNEVSE